MIQTVTLNFVADKIARTSPLQLEMYLQYKKQFSQNEEAFKHLGLQLNQENCGPKRTMENWKRVNLYYVCSNIFRVRIPFFIGF